MVDYKTFYSRRYGYSKSDLKSIAKEGREILIQHNWARGKYYYDNIIETAFYADGSATYDELDFFLSTSDHGRIDKAELYRLNKQAWDVCEYYDTIPDDLRSKPAEVQNAVIVISIAACLVDGSLNTGEIRYLNRLIGYNFI